MRKIIGNILVILSVLFVLMILQLFHNNSGINILNAYTPGAENCYPPFVYGPNLVNAMQGPSQGTCPTSGPPADSHNDYTAWQGYAPSPYTPPGISLNWETENCTPSAKYGTGYLRITWTGNSSGSQQYIYLSSTYFENQGCSGNPYDWSCYDYVRFYIYNNECKNQSSTMITQSASIYDNNGVTINPGSVVLKPVDSGIWDIHWTASLNYIRNQYDLITGNYLDIHNINGFRINAIHTNFSNFPLTPPLSETHPSGSRQAIIYYDYLTLGASDALPEYGSPTNVNISTAGQGTGIMGALISWDYPSNPVPTPGIPITGYHIYRSLNSPGGGHPYVAVGIVSSYAVNNITDTTCPGGNTYCYKVLVLNNGPATSADFQKLNTINATYHESLLDDVPQYCGWVNAKPPTPTATWTPPPGGWPTNTTPSQSPTSTPTFTATTPPPAEDIAQAHVYPNPYNPDKGSRMFYVDNVPDKTKIYIYAMDGTLVKDGVFNSVDRRFAWNGLNKNGSRVVSGLYYLVLEDPAGNTRVLRIIVCYNCDPVYRP